ncbi:phage major capsid protein [Limibacillus sp. MBR-115]|uniref:phage major capsid protein n=1 Tax=Limibacillus sp. MBR-115 TaxID=3156465 RepID=UPI00339A0E08
MKDELQFRSFRIDRAGASREKRTVPLVLSTDFPVDVRGFKEVLVHSREAVDLSRAAPALPLLLNHDATEQVGVVENVHLDGGKLRGTARVSRSPKGEEVLQDILDGIRISASVGYRILLAEQDGETVRVTRWQLFEASLVAIPADTNAGAFRNGVLKMEPNENKPTETAQRGAPGGGDREKEITEILALGDRMKNPELARQAIREQWPLDKFRHQLLEKIGRSQNIGGPVSFSDPLDGLSRGDRRDIATRFDLGNLIRAAITGDHSSAALELETAREIQRRSGLSPEGLLVPAAALAPQRALSTRATLTSGNTGANLIGTEHRFDAFIEALTNEAVVIAAGATVLDGLIQDVSIPKKTTTTSAQWVAEQSAPTDSTPTLGAVALAPKQLAALASHSRKTLVQALPGVTELIRADMVEQIGIALDAAALNGGGANEPVGVLQTSGIGAVAIGTNGGAITWPAVVDLVAAIHAANALSGSRRWVTTPEVVAAMQKTERASGTAKFILDELAGGKLLTYETMATNGLPKDLTKGTGTNLHPLIFGNWASLLVGIWSAVDLIVDPYTNADTGQVRIAAHAFFDVGVRHAESFAAITDIDPTA